MDFIWTNIMQAIRSYKQDGSYEELIPPLQLLFDAMEKGEDLLAEGLKKQFEHAAVLGSGWYNERLQQA